MCSEHSSLAGIHQDGFNPPVSLQQNNINQIQPMDRPGMDLGVSGMRYDTYGFTNINDLDFLMNSNDNNNDNTTMFYGDSGFDLGIDEGNHWGNGPQLDLFDGFFFGNVGNSG